MNAKFPHRLFLASAFVVSLEDVAWERIPFGKKNESIVEFKESVLHTRIASSSSALLHRLETPSRVKRLSAQFRYNGRPKLPDDRLQGEAGADDYLFRLGLVKEGQRRLSFFERIFAARWILRMEELAQERSGFGGVHFLLIANKEKMPLWKERQHPSSELFTEEIVASTEEDSGTMALDLQISIDQNTIGIWWGPDGDDTSSSFELWLSSLLLHTELSK